MEPATATLIATGAMMAMQGVGSYMAGSAQEDAAKKNIELQKFLQNQQLEFQKQEKEKDREFAEKQFEATAPLRGAQTINQLQPTIQKRDALKNMVDIFRS